MRDECEGIRGFWCKSAEERAGCGSFEGRRSVTLCGSPYLLSRIPPPPPLAAGARLSLRRGGVRLVV